LTVEIEDAKLTFKEETNQQLSTEAAERVRQYDNLHLKDKLVENGWYVYSNIHVVFVEYLYVNF
jgi:hypothetical protein